MTACPKCGADIEEGKAYCSNPACGAVTGARPAPETKTVVDKQFILNLKFDFVLIARLAALAIAALALAVFYFSARS
ncbi:MAG TPA: hypothetical protein DEQ38_00050 [Elusimicrobia bacterium]|nr:MAG: hypothetical protein A2089_04510 [Elusimicrobia bacterium GWD2_63_28]HCC46505.1 hypothetical protein [Elusimicrobiota bacterium]